MSTLAAIRRSKAAHGLRTVFSILLLVFYVAGASQMEALHLLFHTHSQISHSEEQEKDPCHLSVYHLEVEKGCGHHAHIVVTDKCELCDVICYTDSILLSAHESQAPEFFTIDFVLASVDIVDVGQTIVSSRAPPAV
jgi:hypothetical protein